MGIKYIFVAGMVALTVAQIGKLIKPIPTNFQKGSLRYALRDGTIADVCYKFTGYPEELLYKNQNCTFPEDNDVSKDFKYCYLSFFLKGNSREENCMNINLIRFLSTPDEIKIVESCSIRYLPKCCLAAEEERTEACLDMMNCYINCVLNCENCPVEFT